MLQQRGQLGAARSLFLAIAALGPASASLQERQQALEWAEMLATVSGDLEEAGQMRRRINGLFEAGELAKRDPDPLPRPEGMPNEGPTGLINSRRHLQARRFMEGT